MTSSQIEQPRIDNKKLFAQYYTCENVGDFLIKNLPTMSPRNIIDLCMGEGALLHSANKVFDGAKLVGCDIDALNVAKQHSSSIINCHHLDSSTSQLEKFFNLSTFDLVLGNPPFNNIEQTDYIKNIFNNFGLDLNYKKIPSALLFLIIGIRIVKEDGFVSYIIPDSLLTNNSFKKFREILISQYEVISVVQLGNKKFEGTEAHTHIITIKNKVLKNNYKIQIKHYENQSQPIYISKEQFINRADYSYWNKATSIKSCRLEDLGAQLFRGKLTHKQLKNQNRPYIHTTHLNDNYAEFYNQDSSSLCYDAKSGDIVVSRVGTRSLGKIGFVKTGAFLISDCIILIRIEKQHQYTVLNTLNSDFGRSWLESVSKGVGARHITLADLKGLPIYNDC